MSYRVTIAKPILFPLQPKVKTELYHLEGAGKIEKSSQPTD